MKTLLLIFSLTLFTLRVCGQKNPLIKTWVNEKLRTFEINDSEVFNDSRYHSMYEYHYHYTDSMLTLILLSRNDDGIAMEGKHYPFTILKLTSDTLILKPGNEEVKNLFTDTDLLVLIDKAKINDPGFRFEKLFFSGTTCYGTCPGMKAEIDSSGSIFFEGTYNTGKYNGLYHGQLSHKKLEQLKNILQRSWLDNFPGNLWGAIDAPVYTFVFYYNGKRKESHGSFVPYFEQELLSFLYTSYRKQHLKKLKGAHIFER
ncbi:DUF6438 domain-containing protein [Chitinophagaceae bacterium MMS25-I14]